MRTLLCACLLSLAACSTMPAVSDSAVTSDQVIPVDQAISDAAATDAVVSEDVAMDVSVHDTAAVGQDVVALDETRESSVDVVVMDVVLPDVERLDASVDQRVEDRVILPVDAMVPDAAVPGVELPSVNALWGCDVGRDASSSVFRYVRPGATGGDGTRARPFSSVQEALRAVRSGERAVMCISAGTYVEFHGDERDLFSTGTQYSLIGGFSSDFSERDPQRFTVLLRAPDRTLPALRFGNVRAITLAGLSFTNGSHGVRIVGGYSAGRTLTVLDCRAYANGIDGMSGHTGAGMQLSGGRILFARNTLENNTGGRLGAGLFIGGAPSSESNRRDASGALVLGSAFATVVQNVVRGNTLRHDTPHGVGIAVSMNALIANNLVVENAGYSQGGGEAVGGGIFVQNQDVTALITNNTVMRNRALTAGPGIFVDEACVTTITNNIVARNIGRGAIAVDGRAGGNGAMDRGWSTIVNNTVVFNQDAALMVQDSATAIYNNLFWSNGPEDLYVATGGAQPEAVTGDYNLLRGMRGNIAAVRLGMNVLQQAPSFVDAERDNYRLAAMSVGVDRGTSSAQHVLPYNNAPMLPPSTDFDGVNRPRGEAIDLGAFER